MRSLQKFIIALFVLTLCSCTHKDSPLDNSNAIWLWSTHMKEAPLQEWADKGLGHVLLNEAAFWKCTEEDVLTFVAECKRLRIRPHVWFQCYARDRKWTFPVDEQTKTLKQEYFDDMIARAEKYVRMGFEGIHLDYIRFCGNAADYDLPQTGLTAVGIVNECCRQMHDAVKAIDPDVIMSAALMPEIDSEEKYGQRPSEMAQWLDVLMPMIYRYGYYGKDKPVEWVSELTSWFVQNSAGKPVWVGVQTYSVNLEDNSPVPLDADGILSECDLIRQAGAEGVVFFRHGLGTIPDMDGFWE